VECKEPSFTERKESKASKQPTLTFHLPLTPHTSLALTLYQMSMPAILSLWLNRSSTRYPFSLVIFDMQVLLPFQSIFCINTPPVIKIPEVGKTITYTPSWHALTHLYVLLSAQWLACLPLCGC